MVFQRKALITMIEVTSPSNIAFLKYWGKSDRKLQWPAGDSLSMTLRHAVTVTKCQIIDGRSPAKELLHPSPDQVEMSEIRNSLHQEQMARNLVAESAVLNTQSSIGIHSQSSQSIADEIYLDGKITLDSKIIHALKLLREHTGYQFPLMIKTSNSFPKSCGIASSASGMSALVIACLCAWTESNSFEDLEKKGYPKSRLADLARLCSGSAGRSLYGGFVEWLKSDSPKNQQIIPYLAPSHWHLSDLILLVSDKEKAVSSREAHDSAWSSPLFSTRLSGLSERLKFMKDALLGREIEILGPLLETEALEMHAVIMTANPPVNYLTKETTLLLKWIRDARASGRFKAWFTIDAGPNIHLLSEISERQKIIEALGHDHPELKFIADETGYGPKISIVNN